jgi:hypothetical protein
VSAVGKQGEKLMTVLATSNPASQDIETELPLRASRRVWLAHALFAAIAAWGTFILHVPFDEVVTDWSGYGGVFGFLFLIPFGLPFLALASVCLLATWKHRRDTLLLVMNAVMVLTLFTNSVVHQRYWWFTFALHVAAFAALGGLRGWRLHHASRGRTDLA